jgi:uncharacterized protein (DUF2236 family)
MAVEPPDLECALDRVRGLVRDPRAGIFGPGSRVWTLNREGVVFLGGGRAALLQLAHPAVAQAVADHSRTREDMLGRFRRTFEHVFAMVYGDLESALDSARRVHQIHGRIRGVLPESVGAVQAGTPYEASDPDALLWVHATLCETSVQVFELILGPLARPEKDAYWEETKRFAALFGIPDALVPRDWRAFRRYWDGMLASDLIRVSTAARELAGSLLRAPSWWLAPAWGWLRLMTARLLPPRLRTEFGLSFGVAEAVAAEASLAGLRSAWWVLPGGIRWLPAYRDAIHRLEGTPGRDPIGVLLERLGLVGRGAG